MFEDDGAIAALMEAVERQCSVTLGAMLGSGGMGVVHMVDQPVVGAKGGCQAAPDNVHAAPWGLTAIPRDVYRFGAMLSELLVSPVRLAGSEARGRCGARGDALTDLAIDRFGHEYL